MKKIISICLLSTLGFCAEITHAMQEYQVNFSMMTDMQTHFIHGTNKLSCNKQGDLVIRAVGSTHPRALVHGSLDYPVSKVQDARYLVFTEFSNIQKGQIVSFHPEDIALLGDVMLKNACIIHEEGATLPGRLNTKSYQVIPVPKGQLTDFYLIVTRKPQPVVMPDYFKTVRVFPFSPMVMNLPMQSSRWSMYPRTFDVLHAGLGHPDDMLMLCAIPNLYPPHAKDPKTCAKDSPLQQCPFIICEFYQALWCIYQPYIEKMGIDGSFTKQFLDFAIEQKLSFPATTSAEILTYFKAIDFTELKVRKAYEEEVCLKIPQIKQDILATCLLLTNPLINLPPVELNAMLETVHIPEKYRLIIQRKNLEIHNKRLAERLDVGQKIGLADEDLDVAVVAHLSGAKPWDPKTRTALLEEKEEIKVPYRGILANFLSPESQDNLGISALDQAIMKALSTK